MEQSRRRIDRVTSPDLLDGIESRPPVELRRLRDDCREEEARLSYTRRLLQGQLDVLRAEQARRGAGEAGGLVEQLPSILRDEAPPGDRVARSVPVYMPEQRQGRRRSDAVLDDMALGSLPDLPAEDLADMADRLEQEERIVSELRRMVLKHLDELQDELIRRYREGSVDVDEVVASAAPPTGPADEA